MKHVISILFGLMIFVMGCQFSFGQDNPEIMQAYTFINAINNGDINTVKKCINSGININRTFMDATPLLYSIDKYQYEVLDYLIEKGADVNFKEGVPPLYYAVVKKNKYATAKLLKAGADIQKAYMGKTAKSLAQSYSNKDFINIFENFEKNPNDFNPNTYKPNPSTKSQQNGQILSANITYNMTKKDTNLITLEKIPSINSKAYSEKVANDNNEYQKNKKILSEEQYKLYIILDKLLRANNLQYQNWRIGIDIDTKNINASAGSANLIIVNSSLYDSLYQNEDALAFVIAHELSHLILGHNQIALENSIKINELKETIKKITEYERKEEHYARISKAAGNSDDALIGTITGFGYVYLKKRLNKEINKIYAQEQNLEIIADAEALTLMTKAGYDPQRAKDTLEFLSNIPDVYTKRSTHPANSTRLSNINEHLFLNNDTDLKNLGRKGIINSKVLALKKSSDKKTIILSKENKCVKHQYISLSKENKLIKKAYKYYLDDDYQKSKDLFNQAYMINPNNFIPAIYLSYINEYDFKQNQGMESLKQAKQWAKKAYKIEPKNKYAIKQQEDIKEIFVSLKEQKKNSN